MHQILERDSPHSNTILEKYMKKSLVALMAFALFTNSYAVERLFRVDRTSSIVDGYAVAWGIPNQVLDFEKIDALGYEEASKVVEFDRVKNFVVDLQTNAILFELDNADFAEFTIGDVRYGNHYRVSLESLAVDNLLYNVEVLGVVENYKWSSDFTKLLVVDRTEPVLKVKELNGLAFSKTIQNAIKKFIKKDNLEVFVNGSKNIESVEGEYTAEYGKISKITLDYSFPKSEENSLRVEAFVKLNYENGQVVPTVFFVTQEQY